MKEILTRYRNGNYTVFLLEDGTKIRINNLDNLTPSFAESIDCTITKKCDGGCPYCYLGCTEEGKHADLHQPIFDTLHYGQELALNGNDLSHPELHGFLVRMKKQGVICNITVNQKHFLRDIDKIIDWSERGLIRGVGVSLTDSNDPMLYKGLYVMPNTVVHVIDGLLTEHDINNMADRDIKLLILGYKQLGRGDDYYVKHNRTIQDNIKLLRNHMQDIVPHFKVVSFDNLAIDHLEMKYHFTDEEWDKIYMGDEGQYTSYIDAVDKKYAVSSLAKPIGSYDEWTTVDMMFKHVREVA